MTGPKLTFPAYSRPAMYRTTTTGRPLPPRAPAAWPRSKRSGSSPDTRPDAPGRFPAYFEVHAINFRIPSQNIRGFGPLMREFLLRLSENKRLAPFIIHNGVSRRVARRFVAGETLEDANVSLKLTQLGLDLGEDLCRELLEGIVEHAASLGNFVRIDMEGSAYTQRTVEITKRVRAEYSAVGIVMQAYLYRTEQDVRDLLAAGCRMRLCKGSYKEPPEVAFAKKSDVDANYVKLMKLLLPSGIYHGIATHDPVMIQATKDFAREKNIANDKFEFQMLYGIGTDLQKHLVREGYRLRVYIPFGTDWFPYFMRRLAERPANVAFFLRNLLPRASNGANL